MTEQTLFGDRDGFTYERDEDLTRLNRQAALVFRVMRDGHWRTLSEISDISGCPEASVSARLRDFRKERFGGHTVERKRDTTIRGMYWYRLVRRTD